MEFFAAVPIPFSTQALQHRLTIDRLPDWCASIDRVLESRHDKGEIYCIWGQFRIRREITRDGLRFTLPGCPNALQWTVTSEGGEILVHLTINRRNPDPDFVESIEQFIGDWQAGIEKAIAPAAKGESCSNNRCNESFSGFG
jgi:hypothetical protein